MSALQAKITSGSVALVAATAKTVLQVGAPANQRVKVLGIKLTADGVTSSAVPISVRILRQTTAGTMTSVTPVPVEKDLSGITIQSTGAKNASAEPTASDVLDTFFVPAFMGAYEVFYPFGQELIVQNGKYLGIECTAPANVNVQGMLTFEE